MEQTGENNKRRAHELIEQLAPKQTSAVGELLELILDPVSRAIANAPDRQRTRYRRRGRGGRGISPMAKHNKGIPHQQVLADLGVTPEEIERLMKSM